MKETGRKGNSKKQIFQEILFGWNQMKSKSKGLLN
jgi:hypothetical protein